MHVASIRPTRYKHGTGKKKRKENEGHPDTNLAITIESYFISIF